MRNLLLLFVIVLSSNFCKGQLQEKEKFLNDFWKNHISKDSLAYLGCTYPEFDNQESIHQSFDEYLSPMIISKMLETAKDTVVLLWDSSKVKGVKFISNNEGNSISGGPCYLEFNLGDLSKSDDTELVRRYNYRKEVMAKYHNPSGVYGVPYSCF